MGIVGLLLLWVAQSHALWRLIWNSQFEGRVLGELLSSEPTVRHRARFDWVWEDQDQRSLEVGAGSQVFTSDRGTAQLTLTQGLKADLDPSTLVEILEPKGGRVFEMRLEQGSTRLTIGKGAEHIRVWVRGRAYEIESDGSIAAQTQTIEIGVPGALRQGGVDEPEVEFRASRQQVTKVTYVRQGQGRSDWIPASDRKKGIGSPLKVFAVETAMSAPTPAEAAPAKATAVAAVAPKAAPVKAAPSVEIKVPRAGATLPSDRPQLVTWSRTPDASTYEWQIVTTDANGGSAGERVIANGAARENYAILQLDSGWYRVRVRAVAGDKNKAAWRSGHAWRVQ